MAINRRAFYLLAVLIFCVTLTAQTEESVIKEMYLIKSRLDTSPQPPDQIRIGLEASKNVFYKLIREGAVVQAGLFPQGFNSIPLSASPLLDESGERLYILELKTESNLVRHEITLDVRLEPLKTKEEETARKIHTSEHTVSLFINGELIASRKKRLEQKLPWPEKTPPLPPNYDPFDPDPMDNPLMNSVSIFQAAGLAYYLIKELFKKKDEVERVPPIQKAQQISLEFRKYDPQGTEAQFRAKIRLSTRILRQGPKGPFSHSI